MNEANIDSLQLTLNSLRHVRASFTNLFKTLANIKEREDENEKPQTRVFSEFENYMKELERNINMLNPSLMTQPESNLDLIAFHPSPDKFPMYHQVRECYTWIDKVSSYSSIVQGALNSCNLKRSNQQSGSKRRRYYAPLITVPSEKVDQIIQNIKSRCQDMLMNILRPVDSIVVIQITLGNVLRATVAIRGLLIEWVVVRALNEPFDNNNGKPELYQPSQYKVFQKVTEDANAAMLHYGDPSHAEISLISFFSWLQSYSSLFTEACGKCGYHLHNNLPPTWREFRTFKPFHEECRP